MYERDYEVKKSSKVYISNLKEDVPILLSRPQRTTSAKPSASSAPSKASVSSRKTTSLSPL